MVTHYEDGSGKARVKGGSALKQSQAYPRKFFGNYLGELDSDVSGVSGTVYIPNWPILEYGL